MHVNQHSVCFFLFNLTSAPGSVSWLYGCGIEMPCSQIGLLGKETIANVAKKEAPQWTSNLVASLGHTDATEIT